MRSRPPREIPPLRSPFDDPAFCCKEAERFSAWVGVLIARLTKDGSKEPTHEQMWEAKAKLVDEYRRERNGAFSEHRDQLANSSGSPCIHGVFITALDRLADITISPKITPPPSSPRRRQAEEKPASWLEELGNRPNP